MSSLRPTGSIVWIERREFNRMMWESDLWAPAETGGVLVGYWTPKGAVVVAVGGPGPNAVHNRFGFQPDYPHQDDLIAERYKESGRIETYLGDWHSHPTGGGGLSRQDRSTLRRIAGHGEARTPAPIMAIMYGHPDWQLSIWRYVVAKTYGLLSRSTVKESRVVIY
jgi:integrative and conjugative element protein (TIGR02256 family)